MVDQQWSGHGSFVIRWNENSVKSLAAIFLTYRWKDSEEREGDDGDESRDGERQHLGHPDN